MQMKSEEMGRERGDGLADAAGGARDEGGLGVEIEVHRDDHELIVAFEESICTEN
jgi:hypothetical protein